MSRFRYAVAVIARNRYGNFVRLRRIGGGERERTDENYYPTVLWFVDEPRERRRYFDPSKQGFAWNTSGPDYCGPYTVERVVEFHTSDDPMKAMTRGFAAEFTEEQP